MSKAGLSIANWQILASLEVMKLFLVLTLGLFSSFLATAQDSQPSASFVAAIEELSFFVLLDSYNIFKALKYIICIAKNVNDAVYKTVVDGITFKIEKHSTPMLITKNEINTLFPCLDKA